MLAIRRKQWPLAAGAGVVLGLASTVKVTAFMALPGMVVLAWVLLAPPRPALFMRYVLLLLLPAIIIQLPWELWQWRDIGSPFPGWAGKPSASLVASNPYIHFVTVTRSPWIYLTLTPVVLWTFVPDFILLGARWRDRSVRNSGLALLFWLLSIIAVHIALGFLGYSKLLRYVILAVPAGILLFSLLASETITRCRSAGSRLYSLLVAVSLVALVLEISCGVMASFDFGADLIVPLFTGT
jgi:4-amino-4-deoxy-L-arabinose transferase-like glycosyltransferase